MHKPSVDIYRDEAGGWRWRLKAANGEIVASGESYGSPADAERSFKETAHIVVTLSVETFFDSGTWRFNRVD